MADMTPVLIKDLEEQTTASDIDYMIIGGTDAKKITWSTIANLIKAKLGIGTASDLTTSNKEIVGAINELDNDIEGLGDTYLTRDDASSTYALASRIANGGLLADYLADAKNLNITTTSLGYVGTTYMVVIQAGGTIAAVMILNAYTTATSLTALASSSVVKLYESTTYAISGVYGVREGDNNDKIRTKIEMKTASSGYRAFVHPLGNRMQNDTVYTAYWATT